MAVEQFIGKSRTCKKCNKVKDLGEFYAHPHCADGRLHKCKECFKRPKRPKRPKHTVAIDPDNKRCSKCERTLPLDNFGLDPRRSHGRKTYCKQCRRQASKKYREANPEKSAAATRNWAANNPDKIEAKRKRWIKSNPGRQSYLSRLWKENNKERCKAAADKHRAQPSVRIMRAVGQRIRDVLGGKEYKSTVSLVGYDGDTLRVHLEKQFLRGMSWSNYGEWHIDHIVPLSSFSVSSLDDPNIRRAWCLSNLRPLWAADNIRKKDKRTHLI